MKKTLPEIKTQRDELEYTIENLFEMVDQLEESGLVDIANRLLVFTHQIVDRELAELQDFIEAIEG